MMQCKSRLLKAVNPVAGGSGVRCNTGADKAIAVLPDLSYLYGCFDGDDNLIFPVGRDTMSIVFAGVIKQDFVI